MLPSFAALLAAFAFAFGAQNKADFLRGKARLLDRMLECCFCTGFHAGWIVWLLHRPAVGLPPWWQIPPEVLLWALASAGFSYGSDTVLQLVEASIGKPPFGK